MMIKLSSNNVYKYLFDTGICQEKDLKSMIIEPKSSNSWMLSLQSGCQLIVKQEPYYHNDDTNKKIKTEWRLNRFWHSCQDLVYSSSLDLEIIHFDESNSILIYKYPKDYIELESYYINQKSFQSAIAEFVGITLAILHRETLNSRNCYDLMNETVEGKLCNQFLYPVHLQDRLEPERFFMLPPESYMLIGFYQRSESLRAAVKELVVHHNHYCLAHNKLHLNNILIPRDWEKLLSQTKHSNKSIVKITNWESYSWGDPASDLGTAIAGYLLLWLNSLIVHPDIELEKSLQLATTPLEVIQPSIVTMTRAYISKFPEILEDRPDFLKRVIQFSGLGLIYNVIARIQSFKGFNNQSLSILHVAKSLLCRPKKSFKSVFGITELALIDLRPLSNIK